MSSPNDSTPVTQPTIAPDDAIAGTAPDVAGTEVPTTQSQPIAVTRKMSPEEEQYLKAIAMSSAELGTVIKKPTERIAMRVGNWRSPLSLFDHATCPVRLLDLAKRSSAYLNKFFLNFRRRLKKIEPLQTCGMKGTT